MSLFRSSISQEAGGPWPGVDMGLRDPQPRFLIPKLSVYIYTIYIHIHIYNIYTYNQNAFRPFLLLLVVGSCNLFSVSLGVGVNALSA